VVADRFPVLEEEFGFVEEGVVVGLALAVAGGLGVPRSPCSDIPFRPCELIAEFGAAGAVVQHFACLGIDYGEVVHFSPNAVRQMSET
jgi:hypothetical protein